MEHAERSEDGDSVDEYTGYVVRAGPDLYDVRLETKNGEPFGSNNADSLPRYLQGNTRLNSDLFEKLSLDEYGARFIYIRTRGKVGEIMADRRESSNGKASPSEPILNHAKQPISEHAHVRV